jgi:dolichol-phosphate mannosyltransferase
MPEKVVISVVSPVYSAEGIIDELVRQIQANLGLITEDYEVILVEDNSRDSSWTKIEENCAKDARIKGIKLSKNFGQHSAINAGLRQAIGEWIVVMDCDLQDRPDEIPNLFTKALEGFDIVIAQRMDRKDSLLKKFFSWAFYRMFSYLTDTKQDSSIANFGIYRDTAIRAILSMGDQVLYFPAMVQWVGFKKVCLPTVHNTRFEGKSSYNMRKLLRLAIDVIINFSDKPLRVTIKTGFAMALVSFIVGIGYFIGYLSGSIQVAGFASLIISIWFLAGLVILVLGVLGLYIGRSFEAAKKRPIFIIEKKVNVK